MDLRASTETTMARRWPALAAELDRLAPPAEAVWVAGVPQPTLRVDGVQLCGAVDPRAEAALQAERAPMEAARVTVYDPAQGALPRALLARPRLRHLEVVLLAPAAFRATWDRVRHDDWLGDPRVVVRRADPDERPRGAWVVSPAGLRLAEPRALALRDQIALALAEPTHRRLAAQLDEELARALRDNAALLAAAGDVATWFGTRPGARAVVVASGPSVSDQLPWLRSVRGERLVLAVHSAVHPLLAAGVVPDAVVAVDGQPTLAHHLAPPPGADLRAVPLVHAVCVHGDALRAWPGPRVAARLTLPRFDRLATPSGRLWCSGTVTHAACDLARQMGATEITLIGADFSYPLGRTHAADAVATMGVDTAGRRLWVADGRGRMVPSALNLIGYLRDLDDWFAAHPTVRGVKRGRAGAAMVHAPWGDDAD